MSVTFKYNNFPTKPGRYLLKQNENSIPRVIDVTNQKHHTSGETILIGVDSSYNRYVLREMASSNLWSDEVNF